jgi:hypothetical protein
LQGGFFVLCLTFSALSIGLICLFCFLKPHFSTPSIRYIVTVCENNADGLFLYSWPSLEEPTISSILQHLAKEATKDMEENLDIDEFYLKLKDVHLLPYHDDFCVINYRLDDSRILQLIRSNS